MNLGAPVVASNPHFLYCDDDIKESITGMEPNELDHESYLNIEPVSTGTSNIMISYNVRL